MNDPELPYSLLPLVTEHPATDSQRQALKLGRNLVVEAGAGTGKTEVLINRLLACVLAGSTDGGEPVRIQHLAALTFTEKAAQELKTRFAAAIDRCLFDARFAKRAGSAAPELRARLVRARHDFPRHRLGTIHGFCRGVLARFALESGLDPAAEVLDPDAASDLIEQAVSETLREAARRGDLELNAALSQLSDWHLQETLAQLVRDRLRADTGFADLPREWESSPQGAAQARRSLQEAACALVARQAPRLDALATLWPAFRTALNEVRTRLSALHATLCDEGDAPAALLESCAALEAALDAVPAAAEFSTSACEALKALFELSFSGGGKAQRLITPGKPPLYKLGNAAGGKYLGARPELQAALRDLLRALQFALHRLDATTALFFDAEVDRREAVLHLALAPLYRAACRRYAQLRRGALDFGDLIALVRRMVDPGDPGFDAEHGPEIIKRLREQTRYLFVDEFQDTDFDQWAIFRALIAVPYDSAAGPASGFALLPDRVFLVGDPKQSIYRFRGAEVEVFRRARHAVERGYDGAAPPAGFMPAPGLCLPLTDNFRTKRELLAVTNALSRMIFEHPADQGEIRVGGVIAPEPAQRALYEPDWRDAKPGRMVESGPSGSCTLLYGRKTGALSAVEAEDGVPSYDDADQEGETIARFLRRRWLAPPFAEAGARTLGLLPSDVAILLRSRTSLPGFEEALRRNGMPVTVLGGIGFYERREVQDLLVALQALLDPRDDFAMVGFLRSGFCALDDRSIDALHRQRRARRVVSFWDAVRFAAAHDDATAPDLAWTADDRATFQALAARIEHWRSALRRRGVAEFLAYLIDESGCALLAAAQTDRDQQRANRGKLIELAHEHERRFGVNPQRFWETLRQRIDRDARESQAEIPSDSPGIRILTIHGAKGLEFPAVIVPALHAAKSGGGHAPFARWADDNGAQIVFRPEVVDDDALPGRCAAQAAKEERAREAAENRRLFYVAITRARDHLALSGLGASRPVELPPLESFEPTHARLDARRGRAAALSWLEIEHGFHAGAPPAASIPVAATELLPVAEIVVELTEHRHLLSRSEGQDELLSRLESPDQRRADFHRPDFTSDDFAPSGRDAEAAFSHSELRVFAGCAIRHWLLYVEKLRPEAEDDPGVADFDGHDSEVRLDEAFSDDDGPKTASERSRAARLGRLVHAAMERNLDEAAIPSLASLSPFDWEEELRAPLSEHLAQARRALVRLCGPSGRVIAREDARMRLLSLAPPLDGGSRKRKRAARLPVGTARGDHHQDALQVTLTGDIDALVEPLQGAAPLIVDYKTGAPPRPEDEARWADRTGVLDQMRLYAWLLGHEPAQSPPRAVPTGRQAAIIFTAAPDRVLSLTFSAAELAEFEEHLRVQITAVLAAAPPQPDSRPRDAGLCAWCEFHGNPACPYQSRNFPLSG